MKDYIPLTNIDNNILSIYEVITQWREALLNLENTKKKFVLFNYQTHQFNFKRLEINIFLKSLISKKEIFENKKIGVITTDPKITCFFMIIEPEIFKLLKTEVKVFSTERAALQWDF